MPHRLTLSLLLLFAAASARAQPTGLGPDLVGWELVATTPAEFAAVCRVDPQGVATVTGQPVSFFATKESHQNYRLEIEWRWPGKPGNGGILLHIASGPKDRAWPECFQVQLKHGAAGDLLPMAGASFAEPLSTPAGAPTAIRNHNAADSEKAAGEWNLATVICRDDTIEVSINGVLQNRVTGCSLRAGRVGFQLEGTPFELRGVRITPLP